MEIARNHSHYDYRTSHTAPGKGESYEENFRKIPWRTFVWDCEKRVLNEILKKYFIDTPIHHLDFACGTGRILGALTARTRTSVGVDVSERMLDVAKRKVPGAEIIRADITREDALGGRFFNLITAFRFFPNAQAELRVESIRALVRHLTPEGILVFNNHKNRSSLLSRLGDLVGKRRGTMGFQDVRELVSSVGLEVVEVFGIGVLPATDRFMFAPRWAHRLCDCAARAAGVAQVLGQNVIYLSRRVSHSNC